MLDKAKMMADAYRLRKAIEAEEVSLEENGIKIRIGGDLKIRFLSINGSENNALMEVINKAIRKAQEMAALKMKEMIDLRNIEKYA
jgi:hypothetical protein